LSRTEELSLGEGKNSTVRENGRKRNVILQRMCRWHYELTTNIYSSVKHDHIFYSGIFRSKKPSSGHYYKNFTTRYKIAQIVLVRCDPA
jgi:hypothetical protein